MKKLFFLAAFAFLAFSAFSQEKSFRINTLGLDIRTDFDYYSQNDSTWSGFTGRHLDFVLKGDINEHFYYAYRQRLNGIQTLKHFFDATDYLYIGWRINKNFSWTAGKEVVAMGGIEYDMAPIDVYISSVSWGLSCYQFGTNFSYTTNDGKNTFIAQLTNSPFGNGLYSGLYNYSLQWSAKFKHFGPLCSVNMFETKNGSFLNVIALSTSYNFGIVDGHVDFLHRASAEQKEFFGHDYSLIGQIGINLFEDKLHIYVKGSYDINDAQSPDTPEAAYYDPYVKPGTDVKKYGGGLEFYPMKNSKKLRLHAFFAVNDTKGEKLLYQGNVGITWRLHFIDR